MTNVLMLYSGAITLGALHAFEPGHGKTLIAAYMIGTKGRAWDGFLLGVIVTVTHTFSVVLLGLIAMILSRTYSDEVLHNWLGLFSASLILLVGIWMLKQRLAGMGHSHFHLFGKGQGHDHHHHDHHDHDHHHDHHHHDHAHPHPHSPKAASAPTSKWELLLLGISGGIIPCPAAIAVLLAAIAAGKIAHGLSITLFFSLGLGLVMMSIGVALSQTNRLTKKIDENLDLGRKIGIVSAVLIILIGSYTMWHSVTSIWFSN
jgi:nickel/cobalt transporter (NicO) family protein